MANTYNHSKRVKGAEAVSTKVVHSGMIVGFQYQIPKTSDKRPLILVLWNDLRKQNLHGINFNYLTESEIKEIITPLTRGYSGSGNDRNDVYDINPMDEDSDLDNNLPSRNLLKKTYTRVDLPYFKGNRDGHPLTRAEASVKMKLLYDRVLKRYVEKYNMYRTYKYKNIKNLKILQYDVKGLVKGR
jgi:hypothetical protein|tara:strand:- start:143 stop:700 length:558 start_codon:yes stop_codon:yes gene_type:complete